MFEEKTRDYIMIGVAVVAVLIFLAVSKNEKTVSFFNKALPKKEETKTETKTETK